MRAKAAPALVREATPRHPCNQTKYEREKVGRNGNEQQPHRLAAAMIEATCDIVEIGAPGGIETVLALAALDEAAMWVGRMLEPRGES